MNFLRTTSALLAGLLVTLMLLPGTASAHAGLAGSDPEDGAVVSALPEQVTLIFTEEVRSPAFVVVTGPDGDTHEKGEAVLADSTALQTIVAPKKGEVAGEWTIGYRVVSADGHPITGHVRFRVSSDAAGSDEPSTEPSTAPSDEPTTAPTDEPTTGSRDAASPADRRTTDPDAAPDATDPTHAAAPAADEGTDRAVWFLAAVVAVMAVSGAAYTVVRKRGGR